MYVVNEINSADSVDTCIAGKEEGSMPFAQLGGHFRDEVGTMQTENMKRASVRNNL